MPVPFTIKVVNLWESSSKLGRLAGAQKAELILEMDLTLLAILRDSKTKPPRVPVDTGALQSTGRTEPTKETKDGLEGAVMYGGVARAPFNRFVDYAVFVHERAANYRRPGAGPGFVSVHAKSRLDEMKRKYEAALGKGARRLFK